MFGPANLPPDVAAKLQATALSVLDDPELRKRLATQAIAVRKLSGQDFKAFLNSENEKYRKIISDSHIVPQ